MKTENEILAGNRVMTVEEFCKFVSRQRQTCSEIRQQPEDNPTQQEADRPDAAAKAINGNHGLAWSGTARSL
jgi:hypothetical protein